jgi:hypothetical protein
MITNSNYTFFTFSKEARLVMMAPGGFEAPKGPQQSSEYDPLAGLEDPDAMARGSEKEAANIAKGAKRPEAAEVLPSTLSAQEATGIVERWTSTLDGISGLSAHDIKVLRNLPNGKWETTKDDPSTGEGKITLSKRGNTIDFGGVNRLNGKPVTVNGTMTFSGDVMTSRIMNTSGEDLGSSYRLNEDGRAVEVQNA